MQSKSSCLPVFFLYKYIQNDATFFSFNEFDILDACSAPGNKTLQLAEYFPNCKIHAFEINKQRFDLLSKNTKQYNYNNNIKLYNLDFLEINYNTKPFKDIQVVLVDPSCSGSGTKNNMLLDANSKDYSNICSNEIAGGDIEQGTLKIRLRNLCRFQIKILNKAIRFPKAKLVCYSTCSIYMTENEYVVYKILKDNLNVELVDLHQEKYYTNSIDFDLNKIQKFHLGLTKETKNALRICSNCHKCDGFFVALFRIKAKIKV